ncbi:hypothetical protein K435DRAFT_383461 [Dendrothele bispora CBS 962.96]|uniref:Uncharacterized protein n=1 Tax=Dendrothele bispora (strain CBS 962.96) TaxID=1314807 RepID=A0A4S8MGN0_DENBC|nr:hypothetical protein K435DRAFT_383461 [Dendrothele bispora CBS 962.96]
MKWDKNGIAVRSFFRAAVPADIVRGAPNPSQWGSPVAALEPGGCDPIKNFVNHPIVFGEFFFCPLPHLPSPPANFLSLLSMCYFPPFYYHDENANNKNFSLCLLSFRFFFPLKILLSTVTGHSYTTSGCLGMCAYR